LSGTQANHLRIRQLIVDQLRSDPGRIYSDYLLSEKIGLPEHIARMSLPATWGTELEIIAFATAMKCDVYIWVEDYMERRPGLEPVLTKYDHPHWQRYPLLPTEAAAFSILLVLVGGNHYEVCITP